MSDGALKGAVNSGVALEAAPHSALAEADDCEGAAHIIELERKGWLSPLRLLPKDEVDADHDLILRSWFLWFCRSALCALSTMRT